LSSMAPDWNISLFHYRNHGADFGRVLAAFEVPTSESGAFEAFLAGLDYRFQLDENNDAYQRFLTHDRRPDGE
jgi:threonine dehydratase